MADPKRENAKKIMKECREDCEEIFSDGKYRESLGQHINSMFIYRTK